MKKTILIASVVLAAVAGSAIASRAQTPFSDVPTDHWAYTAVEKLRVAGIVEGYPDKTYGGARPITRYEFATAIARLQDKIGADSETRASLPTKGDIDALRNEINTKLATRDDTADLRQSIDAFRSSLEQLGASIGDLDSHVNGIDPTSKHQPEAGAIKGGTSTAPSTKDRRNANKIAKSTLK